MKNIAFIFSLLLITLMVTITPNTAEAQFSSRSEAYSLDTLTNSANATFTFSKSMTDQYDYAFNVYNTELSGTATLTCYIEQTLCATCTDWVTTDTIVITDTGNYAKILTGAGFWGYRTRVRFVNTGTGAHKFYAMMFLRRRNSTRFG